MKVLQHTMQYLIMHWLVNDSHGLKPIHSVGIQVIEISYVKDVNCGL